MQLKNIRIKNFRLLYDASLLLEKQTTLIVGRNNSGKTSLTEVMKRLLGDSSPSFRLEDFSFATHQSFWNAFVAEAQGADALDVRKALPTIEIQLTFGYEAGEALGTLNEFVIDLDPACTEALVVARYGLRDGKVGELFADLNAPEEEATPDQIELTKVALFKALRDRVPALFGIVFAAVDPNDATNEKIVEASAVRTLCASGFIGAQRGLDDVSQKDRVVIGKVLENLFATAKTNAADAEGHGTAEELEQAVKDIQDKIGADFNLKLDALMPALSLFGYPSLSDQQLRTETTLDPILIRHHAPAIVHNLVGRCDPHPLKIILPTILVPLDLPHQKVAGCFEHLAESVIVLRMARQMTVDIIKSLDAWILCSSAVKNRIDRVSHALRHVFSVFPPGRFLGRDRHSRIRHDDE
ncbi:ATP-dependent endonuclease of the OLD family [mine drainage metagenome]|uniref:ATP-dependent endonuclease of the OLD family n=1 Tax=mine drainage metagenome TaxID=410659 RepID=T1AZT4_9ZZZZ